MRYSSFYIKNYKGIKELTIDLDKDPKSNVITLVGLNESGKTSILEAINLLEKEIDDAEKHKLIPKSKKFNFNDTIEIHGILILEEDDEAAIQNHCLENGFRKVEPIGTLKIINKYGSLTNLVD